MNLNIEAIGSAKTPLIEDAFGRLLDNLHSGLAASIIEATNKINHLASRLVSRIFRVDHHFVVVKSLNERSNPRFPVSSSAIEETEVVREFLAVVIHRIADQFVACL